MLTVVLFFLFSLIVILIVLWYVVYFKHELHLKKFPGPPPLPIIGNVLQVGVKKDLIPSVSNLIHKYGGPLKLYFGFTPRVVLFDAKSVELILSSNINIKKSNDYKHFHSWLGLGLLTSFGTKWKQHRKLLTPAFHFKILERFIDVFNKQGKILIRKLENTKESEAIDVFPYITLYALDVICEATMNTSINAQLDLNSSYVKSVKEYSRIMIERIISIKMWDWVFRLSKDYHKEKKAVDILHGLSNSVIKSRRAELQGRNLENFMEESDLGLKRRVAFLDMLLTSTINDNPLPHEDIREEVDTFMFEGHDTTTSGISFTLYCISKYADIQDKVYHEITEILDNCNEELSYEHLQKMKYLEQVIRESLRMYPPVPFFNRILSEDVEVQGKIIPKDLDIVVSAYHLHHNSSLFLNPEVFDPERFNTENVKNISLYSYVPFSAGPRNCIGQKFAMLEIKAVICKILLKFKLLPVLDHKPVLVGNLILTSDNGLPVYFKNRDKTV